MSAAPAPPVVDLHQHLWPEPLLARLARRTAAPRLVRRRGGWILESHGEPDWPTDLRTHDPVWRADLARADGLDLALVAPSSPIGMESLPPDEAHALVEAYHDGVASLPAPFRGWAAACLRAPDPAALDRRLAEGFVGLCLPAGALSDPGGAERVGPLLDVLERRGAPLFVHPGPAPWSPAPAVPAGAPAWWPAMTAYVAQMHVAWHTVQVAVRPQRPALRVLFAMLAGLAPLHASRLARRGGAPPRHDPRTFYDTSSYDAHAVAAVAAVTGDASIVHGSDRPVVSLDPHTASDPVRRSNAARLLGGEVTA